MNATTRVLKQAVDRFPALAATLRYVRDYRRHHETPSRTPFGFRLSGNPAMCSGQFEPLETALIRNLLSDAEVFINVGANIGYYCCFALQRGCQVVAFEPMAGNLGLLYRNLQANGWERGIEVYPLALSSSIGILEMYGGGTGASLVKGWADISERFVEHVPVSTLDRIVGRRFEGKRCLVLADVEGAEFEMLRGAEALLTQQPRPLWMVEISVHEHQPKGVTTNPKLLETFDLFWMHGYEARTADPTGRLIERDEVVRVAEGGPDTLLTHNFLFVEAEIKPVPEAIRR